MNGDRAVRSHSEDLQPKLLLSRANACRSLSSGTGSRYVSGKFGICKGSATDERDEERFDGTSKRMDGSMSRLGPTRVL